MAWPRASAVLLSVTCVAVLAAGGALLVRWPDSGVVESVLVAVFTLPSVALGLVLALRRPRNRVAPLLCLAGLVPLVVAGLASLYEQVLVRHPGALPLPPWYPAVVQGDWMLLYLPPALLMLLFPDGRLPGRRWRVVLAGLFVVPAAFLWIAAADPAPYRAPFADAPRVVPALPPELAPLGWALGLALMGLLVASAAAMVARYRRAADAVARAQVRWFALGATLLPATLLLCWLSYLLFDTPDLVVIGLGLTALALPAATAVALLRHDLYDVDRAFSAAVTYGLVTTVLLGVFTVAEVAGGLLLGRGDPATAAVATALSALALAPLRTRLRGRVDRRLYPLRQRVGAALARLRTDIDAGRARPEDLQPVLRDALRDPRLRVGFVVPGRPGLVDGRGAPLDAGAGPVVPVELGGTRVGALLPGGGEASRELLRETAAGAALVVEVVRSRLELGEALREVADSRGRLLHAGYRERRRLERDLHDGAQQRLVSLGMSVRLAQRHLTDGTVDVDGLLDQVVAELGTAVAELRTIARGLRPLDLDGGLAPALRGLVSALPVPVHLDLAEDPVPDEVATTAYYVASEALANVVKHADAARVEVVLAHRDGQVRLRISDDGRGGAAVRPGSGLAGLADRVAAAGGRLAVGEPDRPGTVVEAVLPCAP